MVGDGLSEGAGVGVIAVMGGTAAGAGAWARRGAVARGGAAGVGVGIGIGWTIGAEVGAGVGAAVGRGVGVWPEGGRLKSPTGGVMTTGAWLSCPAAGAARNTKGISAAVARRVNTVTRGALA